MVCLTVSWFILKVSFALVFSALLLSGPVLPPFLSQMFHLRLVVDPALHCAHLCPPCLRQPHPHVTASFSGFDPLVTVSASSTEFLYPQMCASPSGIHQCPRVSIFFPMKLHMKIFGPIFTSNQNPIL